eukprot:1073045-Prorocentrum_minimum.AAC.3
MPLLFSNGTYHGVITTCAYRYDAVFSATKARHGTQAKGGTSMAEFAKTLPATFYIGDDTTLDIAIYKCYFGL